MCNYLQWRWVFGSVVSLDTHGWDFLWAVALVDVRVDAWVD